MLIHERSIKELTRVFDFSPPWHFLKTIRFGEFDCWGQGEEFPLKDIFQEAVDKYNEKQKRNDRKIDDYYDKIHKDDNTHEQRELVVAIGEGKDDPKV